MPATRMISAIAVLLCGANADILETPGVPNLLVYKQVVTAEPVQGHNVTMKFTVYNTGSASAYKVQLTDAASWDTEKWDMLDGSPQTTFDIVKANTNVSFEFVVVPKFAGEWTSGVGSASYVEGELDEKAGEVKYSDERTTVTSNRCAAQPVLSSYEKHLKNALGFGRVISLNMIRTEWGWMVLAVIIVALGAYFGVTGVMEKVNESKRQRLAAKYLKEAETW